MEKSKNEYAALRQDITRRLRGRVLFWVSVGLYLVYLFGVILQAPYIAATSIIPRLILLVWTVILVIQGARTFRLWGRWVDRAVQKEMIRRGLVSPAEEAAAYEKPKRAARLTADGEIEYEDDSETPLHQKRGAK